MPDPSAHLARVRAMVHCRGLLDDEDFDSVAWLLESHAELLAACNNASAASERMWGRCDDSKGKTAKLHAELRQAIRNAGGTP